MVRHTQRSELLDTSHEADCLLSERFASMSIAERATVMADLCDATTQLAIAGIRRQHRQLDEHALRWHLCHRRYGRALADAAFGAGPGVGSTP